jgi:hypothetical protein
MNSILNSIDGMFENGISDVMNNVIIGFLSCALWLAPAYDEDGNESPCDDLSVYQFPNEDVLKVRDLVKPFLLRFEDELFEVLDGRLSPDGNNVWQLVGHDFYLTYNGHGTGFWDREDYYGEELGDRLSEAVGRGDIYAYRCGVYDVPNLEGN